MSRWHREIYMCCMMSTVDRDSHVEMASANITVFYDGLDLTYVLLSIDIISRFMGKPTICIGENKGAVQLRINYNIMYI